MVAISDSIVLAIGGLLTALVTGAFAFAGVVYNARHQRRPTVVKVDPAELARLRDERDHNADELDRLRIDLDHERELRRAAEAETQRWRDAALAAMSRDNRPERPE